MLTLREFVGFCSKNQIELNPADIKFLSRALKNYLSHKSQSVFDGYIEEWYLGMSDAKSSDRQKSGRERANLFVMKLIIEEIGSLKR